MPEPDKFLLNDFEKSALRLAGLGRDVRALQMALYIQTEIAYERKCFESLLDAFLAHTDKPEAPEVRCARCEILAGLKHYAVERSVRL